MWGIVADIVMYRIRLGQVVRGYEFEEAGTLQEYLFE
jgi:hypothetical protein